MPDVVCQTALAWSSQIIDHGIDSGHDNVAWDDNMAQREYGVRCLACDVRFVITPTALRDEMFKDTSTFPRARLLYDGLQTSKGRSILLESVGKRIREGRATRVRTAWDLVLADDEDP